MWLCTKGQNPAHGSGRIIQVRPIYAKSRQSTLMNSSNLNDPPTSVGGIHTLTVVSIRKDLNNPRTTVRGICAKYYDAID